MVRTMAGVTNKPSFVLVHGGNMSTETWNRFTIGERVSTPDGKMGGRIWEPVLAELRPNAQSIFTPTLGDEHVSDLTDHVNQIASLVLDNDLHDVVLAGHSYGGMVITATAAQVADRVRGMVYVDAALPDPGQSLFDIIESGGREPLSFPGLEPAPPYVEKLWFDRSRWRPIPKTYVRCTKSDFLPVTKVAEAKIANAGVSENWSYLELPSWHVPMADMPAEVAKILLRVSRQGPGASAP